MFLCNTHFTMDYLITFRPTNMIAQSQSGTGKTAAFVLTMLSRVDPNLPHTQVYSELKAISLHSAKL